MAKNTKLKNKTNDQPQPDGNAIVCPFCGKPSTSRDHCSHCYAIFNKEVLSVAHTLDEDDPNDSIGPIPLKWAKRGVIIIIALLVVAFVAITELSGSGISSFVSR